ncbi:MAG TPA: hypothetical protein PLA50_12505, partial [Bacteroidia bacterium]|nr:hypothetical protein [Bacteroidia bacterium]
CAGADFREACRNHDACYDVPGSDRDACDRQFLEDMLAECPKSRQPMRARYRAHLAYFGVKFCGKGAWRSAQELAEMAGKLVGGAVHATQVDRLVNPHRQSGN